MKTFLGDQRIGGESQARMGCASPAPAPKEVNHGRRHDPRVVGRIVHSASHVAGALLSFLVGLVAAGRSLRNRGELSVTLLFLANYLFEPLGTWLYWIATYKVLMADTFPSRTNFLLTTGTALLFTAPMAILIALEPVQA